MMHGRYICFVGFGRGTSAHPSNVTIPAGFRSAFEQDSVALYVSGALAPRPVGPDGYQVFGHAFRRSQSQHPATCPGDDEGAASRLLEQHWGIFVGLRISASGTISVLRDPSGQLPCFYQERGDGWAIASDIDLLRQCGLGPVAIDWSEVAVELTFLNHFSRRTALAGVFELLAGEELVIGPHGASVRTAWNPWHHVGKAYASFDTAVEALRDAFTVVHQALASVYPRPLITVSGGLDSAIVATQMSRFAPDASLFTFYTPDDPLGDERAYAEIVASACAVPLSAAPYQAPSFETSRRCDMFLARPTYRTIAAPINARLQDQGFLGGHSAVLGGFGGDNIFCVMASAYALGDQLKARSSWADILRSLQQVREISTASYSDLLRHISRTWKRRSESDTPYKWPRDMTFIADRLSSLTSPGQLHPWLASPAGAPRGAQAHVAALIRAHVYLERFHRSSSVVHIAPLLLSPIVEVCLRIPTWLWCQEGIDRSVARRAAKELPGEIALRRSKGSPQHMHARYFDSHRDEMADFLSNGLMAQRGIVDADAVRRYCAVPPPVRDLDYLRLLELLDAEIWCRHHHGTT